MCNHYRNNPDAIPTWREYIGAATREEEWSDIKVDVWPKYQGIIARVEGGQTVLDSMAWGVPITLRRHNRHEARDECAQPDQPVLAIDDIETRATLPCAILYICRAQTERWPGRNMVQGE